MTLRAKLSLSVGCAMALAIVFTLYLTRQRVSHFVLATEEAHFFALAENVNDQLKASYQEYLTSRVRVVLDMKRSLRHITNDARSDMHVLEEQLKSPKQIRKLSRLLLKNHRGESSPLTDETFYITLTTVGRLKKYGLPKLHLAPNMLNFKQESFEEVLNSISHEGEFSLWPAVQGGSQVLLFFLPAEISSSDSELVARDSDRILVSALRLTSLFQEADALLRARLNALRRTFERIHFYEQGTILLHEEGGRELVRRGDSGPLTNKLRELYALARSQHHASGRIETEAGEYLCQVAWIQAFRWFFVMAVPLDVLHAPSSNLFQRLLMAGIAILSLAVLLTVTIVVHALRPLQRLRDCTSELAALDPSSSSSLDAMESMVSRELNTHRHDELGDLARSFSRMGQELAHNIRASMATMTVKRRMEGELSAARNIQMGILPDLSRSENENGFKVAAFLEPAREVGGDLYDCFSLESGKKALVMGDVSDKGVPAALFMAMTLTMVRYALRSNLSPAEALTRVNTLLEEHNPGNMFVTLFLAIFSPDTGELQYANGGHCPPFVMNPEGEIRQLENLSGPLVGVMPGEDYLSFTDRLKENEILFLYTDGLTEAMNPEKELFGDERLILSLASHAGLDPMALNQAVFSDICAFRGMEAPSDDITMLTFQRSPITGQG